MTFYRQQFNKLVSMQDPISGMIYDLGGGDRSSYFKYIQKTGKCKVKSFSILKSDNPSVVCDLEKGIPQSDRTADVVLAFNVFEHIYNIQLLLKDSLRVLKRDGRFMAVTPFLKEIHGDPQDYWRLTPQAWEKLLINTGYKNINIVPISSGPFIACFSMIQMIFPEILTKPLYYPCLILDNLIHKFKPSWKDKYLMGVFVSAIK